MRHHAPDEFCAFGIGDDPVEKIALDGAADAGARQGLTRQEARGVVLVEPEHGEGDAFGDHDEIGVLEPQRVAFDIAAVDDLEQLRPELALEQDGRARFRRVGPGNFTPSLSQNRT